MRLYDLFLDVRRVTGYTLSEVRHMPIREFWAAVAYDQRQKGQAGQMMAMMLLR